MVRVQYCVSFHVTVRCKSRVTRERCLKVGGTGLRRLNIAMTPIADKYREGMMKSTLQRELIVPETIAREEYASLLCGILKRVCHEASLLPVLKHGPRSRRRWRANELEAHGRSESELMESHDAHHRLTLYTC